MRSILPLVGFVCAFLASGCGDRTSMPSSIPVDEFEPGEPPEGSPVARHGQLSVVDGALVDESGEPVQLKGVSSMWLNYETVSYAENKPGLEWMRDNWNLSVFRAAMGVEPSGAYLSSPAAAKAKVEAIVQNAIELGVYVLVDWHDHHALDHQDSAQAFFAEIAATYGQYPNVIYEPFNEPLIVDWTDELKPYHEALVETIRGVDPDNVIVLGTPQWSQLVDEAAADPLAGDNLMYTLHFYACTHDQWLRDGAQAAIDEGLPLFVTEWGATTADGGIEDPEPCEDEAQLWHDFLNEHQISWAAWKLDGCSEGSCLLRKGIAPGAYPEEALNGHGPFVREKLLE